MNVLVTGAHGRTARIVVQQLIDGGHAVIGIVRKQEYRRELQTMGATVFVVDISDGDLSAALRGVDAVVFAAAGREGEYDRVDHRGVAHVVRVAESAGARRFVLLSANGAHDPESWGPSYAPYLRAKRAGEDALTASSLAWTIVRPAALTGGSATGRVTLLTNPGGSGSIARADVARTVTAVLAHDNTIGKTLELWSGTVPIDDAIAAV